MNLPLDGSEGTTNAAGVFTSQLDKVPTICFSTCGH